MNIKIIGIKGNAGFEKMIGHFTDLGGDVILLDPNMVCGKDHILSAVMHAERAFEKGTNRSKTLLTEIILYAAGERQIGKAMEKMRPKPNSQEMAAIVFDIDDLKLEDIGMEQCDDLLTASPEKAKNLGVDIFEGISCEESVLEFVAFVDTMKQ